VISLHDVAKSFDADELLSSISFSVSAGERVAILGPGGCGKSTILKIILGLIPIDRGTVTLLGADMIHGDEAARQAALRQVGMAFQQGALFDYMTVRENLEFAIANMTELSPDASDARIRELLQGVKLPRSELQFPYELSGGMQRRVGIARAMAIRPLVGIFDEPTSGLDPVTSTVILNMILELGAQNQNGCQIIATSNVEIAMRFADRILMINDGRVIADGPWRQLLLQGDDWVRHFLSARLIGLDPEYMREMHLPEEFIRANA
jgi:phospholipid/cholesterol/gamma-HCH transport system ATP-binding protein